MAEFEPQIVLFKENGKYFTFPFTGLYYNVTIF